MGSLTFLMSGIFPAPIMSWLLWRCFKRAGYTGTILAITLFPLFFSVLDAMPKALEELEFIPARKMIDATDICSGEFLKVPDASPRYTWLSSRIPFSSILFPILYWFPFLFLAFKPWPINRVGDNANV